MPLRPSLPTTLSDDCVRQLRRAILAGELVPGERLPPERVLAAQLGVNRVTVRGALARLTASGLVSVRQGQGYTVQDYRRAGGPDLLGVVAQLATGTEELAQVVSDLLLVRRQLAQVVLQRLGERRPDTAGLDGCVGAFTAAVQAGASPATLARHEADVLAELLDLTGSPVLQVCLNPIRQVVAQLPALVTAMFRTPADNAAGWQAVAAWVADPVAGGDTVLMALLAARDAETEQLLAGR